MRILYISNSIAVSIFGMVLSAAFCDIHWTRRKGLFMAGSMAVLLIFQGIIYFGVDPNLVEYIYPFIVHLPLTVVLCFLDKKILWPTISVLTAYLCCQIRRWQALFAITVFAGGPMMQNMVELVMTLPILLILLRFVALSGKYLYKPAFGRRFGRSGIYAVRMQCDISGFCSARFCRRADAQPS